MTVESEILGGRLSLVHPTTLTGAQRELFDVAMATVVPSVNGASFQSTTGVGRLIGPFNPFLLNPGVASKLLDLQFAEQSQTSLSERVRQVMILAVGATWAADYELYGHSAVARKAGISEGRHQNSRQRWTTRRPEGARKGCGTCRAEIVNQPPYRRWPLS
jgi:4-carboxymuconolactone decarboxylase